MRRWLPRAGRKASAVPAAAMNAIRPSFGKSGSTGSVTVASARARSRQVRYSIHRLRLPVGAVERDKATQRICWRACACTRTMCSAVRSTLMPLSPITSPNRRSVCAKSNRRSPVASALSTEPPPSASSTPTSPRSTSKNSTSIIPSSKPCRAMSLSLSFE